MFTLKLKELDIKPKITDEDVISNKDLAILLADAEGLIEKNHPGIYNPYSLRRKIYLIIRDSKGKTYAEIAKDKFSKELEEDTEKFNEAQEMKRQKFRDGIEAINKEYRERCDLLYVEWELQCNKAILQKEKIVVDDKFETIHDDYAWERDKAEIELKKALDLEYAVR